MTRTNGSLSASTSSPDARARPLLSRLRETLAAPAWQALGMDLETPDDAQLGRWLLAAASLDRRGEAHRTIEALRALGAAGLSQPNELAAAGPTRVEALLEQAQQPRARPLAALLVRLGRGLEEGYAGSLERLAAQCESADELSQRLSRLAQGFGRAGVFRFLRPLRSHWILAADTPLDPAAREAGLHLGLLPAACADESAASALAAALGPEGPDARVVEVWLEQLGRRACQKRRVERCPLGEACPARSAG